MARPNPIRKIMAMPLPSLTYQRQRGFRPQDADVIYAYNIINRYVFDNQLRRPEIKQGIIQKAWGLCEWFDYDQGNGTNCSIRLSDKWFCPQWFMNTLAHEMIHQYQWDIDRWYKLESGKPINASMGAHGPSFYAWRERFEHYDLTLKMAFGQKRWFKHQDFNKC